MTGSGTLRESAAPALRRSDGIRLVRAAPALWRVVDPSGRVIGHLEHRPQTDRRPIRARRFRAASRAFVEVGDFWAADDAVDALRSGG